MTATTSDLTETSCIPCRRSKNKLQSADIVYFILTSLVFHFTSVMFQVFES